MGNFGSSSKGSPVNSNELTIVELVFIRGLPAQKHVVKATPTGNATSHRKEQILHYDPIAAMWCHSYQLVQEPI